MKCHINKCHILLFARYVLVHISCIAWHGLFEVSPATFPVSVSAVKVRRFVLALVSLHVCRCRCRCTAGCPNDLATSPKTRFDFAWFVPPECQTALSPKRRLFSVWRVGAANEDLRWNQNVCCCLCRFVPCYSNGCISVTAHRCKWYNQTFSNAFPIVEISHRDSIWCCQNSPTIPFEVESVGTSFPEIDLSAVDAPHFLNLGHHLTEIGSYTGSPSPQLRRYGRRLAADNETWPRT